MFTEIAFQGEIYPARYIQLLTETKRHEYLIATERLEHKLLNDNLDDYVSAEARYIDEQIFFYIPDELLFADSSKTIGMLEEYCV